MWQRMGVFADGGKNGTLSYDRRTHESYGELPEKRSFRTAPPKVKYFYFCRFGTESDYVPIKTRITYHYNEGVGNFHFVWRGLKNSLRISC